jgi:hypothetical protein
MEEQKQPPTEIVKDIRQMMQRSSRFISLSGLSGIAAGAWALVGTRFARRMLDYESTNGSTPPENPNYLLTPLSLQLIGLAILTFLAAFLSAFFLTWRKTKKEGVPLWDHTTKKLFWSMVIPMGVGALFILGMVYQGEWRFITQACLLFYGLALVSASKYTLREIKYLGYSQLLIGLLNVVFVQYGLIFWALGFGIMHIVYGSIMWWRYEKG